MNAFVYEKTLWDSGIKYIACCDEVGRGCLFGPVVAAAVILKPYQYIDGVKDSKKLSEKKRRLLYHEIIDKAEAIGIGIIPVETIEQINIKNASKLAMKIAVEKLTTNNGTRLTPEAMLIDAEIIDLPYNQEAVIRGEDHVHGIAAASIIAKVTRDHMCLDWHLKYPEYGLDQNKGYGTKSHREALLVHGPSPMHRMSFLKKILELKDDK